MITTLKVSLYTFIIGAVALIIAVSVAVSQLPSYAEMIRRDDLGQMIRVRAANGEIIQTMGPSFGEWITYDRIPPVMREAMVPVAITALERISFDVESLMVSPYGAGSGARCRPRRTGRWR